MKDLISVIVPVYNAEKYIEKCISSICKQDYENLEIILVNDGSTDSTLNILKDMEKRDSRIKLISKENGGAGSAINTALDIAQGSYYVFVDNDDWVDEDYVSFLYEKLKKHHLDIASCTGIDHFENTGKTIALTKYPDRLFGDDEAIIDVLSNHEFTSEPMMKKIYRKELWEGIRCISNRNYQDTYIFLKMLPRCKKMGFFNAAKYHYLVREGSICHSGYKSYSIEQVYAYTENYEHVSQNYPKALKLLEHYIISVSMSNYMRIFIQNLSEKYKKDCLYYLGNFKKYKPILLPEKSKLFLYLLWCISRVSPKFLNFLIQMNRKRLAHIVNVNI